MGAKRIVGAAVIGLTGLGLLAVAVEQLLAGIATTIGVVIAATTLVVGGAFAVVGALSYGSELESQYLFRIAGWNALGVVATTVVLWLIGSFQAGSGGEVTAPLLSGALIVGVSAFAHILIGFNDVRRIRAQTVARQRQKASVMNRFVRHDLKHTAQLLFGYSSQLETDADGSTEGAERAQLAGKIHELGRELGETEEQIKTIDDLLGEEASTGPVDLHAAIERHESRWRSEYPDATFELELPEGMTVTAGEHVETAVVELIENAFEYGGDPPTVTVRGARTDGAVEIGILDDGDGLPEHERALINEDRVETQLRHSSGLGLWLAKWVVEHYGGTLSLGQRADGEGSKVTITLS